MPQFLMAEHLSYMHDEEPFKFILEVLRKLSSAEKVKSFVAAFPVPLSELHPTKDDSRVAELFARYVSVDIWF